MPRHGDFVLDHRPGYGFEEFDELMQQLRTALADTEVLAEALAALHLEGRQLDAQQLARDLHLDAHVAAVIELLASWGDDGLLVHEFGAKCVATICTSSLSGHVDVTTYILARRCERGIEYLYCDENGAGATLGFYAQPPSLLEMTVLVDAVLLAQSPIPLPTGEWRDAYLQDDTMHVTVRSAFYDELSRWYEESIHEWREAHESEDTEC